MAITNQKLFSSFFLHSFIGTILSLLSLASLNSLEVLLKYLGSYLASEFCDSFDNLLIFTTWFLWDEQTEITFTKLSMVFSQ